MNASVRSLYGVEGGGAIPVVAWYSTHPPLPSQLAALERLAGRPVHVEQDREMFADAADIARRYRASGATDLVVVAPLAVLEVLCRQGIKPLWAEMSSCGVRDAEVTEPARRGRPVRHFVFRRFLRLERIEKVFSEPEFGVAIRPGGSDR